MLTDLLASAISEAEKLVVNAPHVRTEQDRAEGYQYLAAAIQATLHAAWAPQQWDPIFITGAGPFTKQGLDNPDTLYWVAHLAGDGEYVVSGKRGSTVDLSFQVLGGAYTDSHVPESIIAFDDRELHTMPGEPFELRFGREPSNGRTNYYTLAPGACQLLVREVYSDWAETRGTIRIERVGAAGAAVPALTEERAERRYAEAAAALVTRIRTWLTFPQRFYLQLPVNTLTEPRFTPGGLATQYSSVGHYDLAGDQAMIITVPKSDAPYQGFQLGSMWYLSLDYVNHQTSLTAAQSEVDPDGMIRLVVSERNPGIANWIETLGHSRGYLQMRWQRLSRALTAADGPTVEIVDIGEVAAKLPFYEQNAITRSDFAARIAARQRAVADRMVA
ncbi:hypothetical protein [Nocardia carnea]|uniref:hypothetical protein n=1 Tax=Nocardia carnea TaxID=37328 RepID=UPI002456E700|nr:hypothetical protein [Nocardia carnea]